VLAALLAAGTRLLHEGTGHASRSPAHALAASADKSAPRKYVASASVPRPSCAPSTLNRSALLDGAVTVTPLPGSHDASPGTQVSFLGVDPGDLLDVTVTGSRSGRHAGRLLAYSQGDGASFVPKRPFTSGESVSVAAKLQQGTQTLPLTYSFTVAVPDTGGEAGGSSRPAPVPRDYQSFVSRPDLRPPTITVTAHSPHASPGDIFLGPYSGPGQYGPMILDEDGRMIWFKPLARGTRAADFRVQSYEGKPVLTWWQDPLVANGSSKAGIVIADSAYRDVAIVRAGNGYQPDLHEFQITAQDTALITVYAGIHCNLSSVGGPSDGAVADTMVQELDLRTGLVMYEWHSLDHVPLSASYVSARPGSFKEPFDFFHINSVDVEGDGDLLIDSRNTWAAFDVDPHTGQILWQLGGKHSSFRLGPGAVTAFQHDARRLANGNITFFDNGATPKIHPQSRAIEVSLDAADQTATLVRRAEHGSPLIAGSQGNVQTLSDGAWMVGWGQQPYLTEYSSEGQVLLDAHMPASYESYRVFRQPWSGQPPGRPAIGYVRSAGAHGFGAVYASWNGATTVASWRVLAGSSAASLSPIVSAPRDGFETAIVLPQRLSGGVVVVQALSAAGTVLATSANART
jgi:hypothetical protein